VCERDRERSINRAGRDTEGGRERGRECESEAKTEIAKEGEGERE